MSPPRNKLFEAAKALCNDFSSKADVDTLLSHFSTKFQCTAIEHGEPCLAPFLGRPFVGLPAVKKYFECINELLSFEHMEFSEYMVDVEGHRVSVKGHARFTWKATGQSWDETFTYRLDFDPELKVTEYEVWADSGAAFLAARDELEQTRKEHNGVSQLYSS